MHYQYGFDSKEGSHESFYGYKDFAKEHKTHKPTRSRGYSFGSKAARFGAFSVHPFMMTQGNTTALSRIPSSVSEVSPASYYIKRLWDEEKVMDLDSKHGWARKLELERWAEIPSTLNRRLFDEKRELKRRLGPGTYNIAVEIKRPTSKRCAMDSRTGRFPKDPSLKFCLPGPGAYGKDGIPATQFGQEKRIGTHSFLEKRSCKRSFEKKQQTPAPNTYNFKDPIQELLNKTVGKRVPEDFYSAERKSSTRTGPRSSDTGVEITFRFEPKSFVQNLEEYANKHKGRWAQAQQYPDRSGERITQAVLPVPVATAIKPGPADYIRNLSTLGSVPKQQLETLKKVRAEKPGFGFNSSTKRGLFLRRLAVRAPGPGRYEVPRLFIVEKDKNTSSFKTTSGQLDPKKHLMYRERLRTKNVALNNRLDLGQWSTRPLVFQSAQHSWA